MTKQFYSLLFVSLAFMVNAQVGIVDDSGAGDFTTTPIPDGTVLEVRSDSRAMILPRLTTNSINSISPVEGMIVYDKILKCFKGYGNGSWQVLGDNCISLTTINFAAASATVNEGDGTTTLSININNPDPSMATTVDVVLFSGNAEDLGNYTSQQINFAAGSNTAETISISLVEDLDADTEDYIFQLQNISGGSNAIVADPSTFTLTVTDNDPQPVQCKTDLLFTEYYDGSSDNKYVEIFNGTGATLDLSDYSIQLYPNGNHISPFRTLDLTGNLANGESYVIANPDATIYANPNTISEVPTFNGDDIVVMTKLGNVIDRIGPANNPNNNYVLPNNGVLLRASNAQPNASYDASEWQEVNLSENTLGSYICTSSN